MVFVYNKSKEQYTGDNVIYIGRGSAYGNPFTHIKDRKTKATFILDSREEAIAAYDSYMREQYKENQVYKNAIDVIVEKDLNGEDVYLGCYCKPLSCHGDLIKSFVEELKFKKLIRAKKDKNGRKKIDSDRCNSGDASS